MGSRKNVEVKSLGGLPIGARFAPQTLTTVQIAPIPADQPPILIAGYDSSDGSLRIINLRSFVEALAPAELVYALDRIDDRDAITATILSGSAIGTVVREQLTVPSGELWVINRINLARAVMGAGEIANVNFRISTWDFPDARGGATTSDYGRAYLPTAAQATDAVALDLDIDLPAQGQLGADLRLEAGAIITLEVTLTGAAAAADRDVTLTPFGRKLKRLVS